MRTVNREVLDLIRSQTWVNIHSSVDRRAWDQIRSVLIFNVYIGRVTLLHDEAKDHVREALGRTR